MKAKLVFGMNQSLDGYVDHERFAPGPELFRHWIDQQRSAAGSLYGRRIYELMRYWDEDQDDWSDDERAFAVAWRAHPKWVVSSTLESVGPNATLHRGDLADLALRLKRDLDGEIEVAGPALAQSLTDLGLIDEYRLYIHPLVLAEGTPLFSKPLPPLRLVSSERIGEEVVRLAYVRA